MNFMKAAELTSQAAADRYLL